MGQKNLDHLNKKIGTKLTEYGSILERTVSTAGPLETILFVDRPAAADYMHGPTGSRFLASPIQIRCRWSWKTSFIINSLTSVPMQLWNVQELEVSQMRGLSHARYGENRRSLSVRDGWVNSTRELQDQKIRRENRRDQ